MSKFTKEEFEKKVQEISEYIEERATQKQKMIKFPSESEELAKDLPADVVIAEAFGQLEDAIICGIDKEGKWWFSTSSTDDYKILWILENFKQILIDAAPQREFNGGREI